MALSLKGRRPGSLLRLFGDVRPGEGGTVIALTINLFLVMTAYYVLKIAREPLILLGGGAEVKSYSAVGQAVLLVGVAILYSWLANRYGRLALIRAVTLFFVVNLLAFAVLAASPNGAALLLGVSFFLWLGIFNLVTVTQFWSFAADLYDEDTGKRLFPIIGIGASLGAVGGAALAERLLEQGSPALLMTVAAAFLLAGLALTTVAHRRNGHHTTHHRDAPVGDGNAFRMVLHDRYLLLLAGLIFVLNISTRTGDYILDRSLIEHARQQASSIDGIPAALYIGQFKARFFQWVNISEIILQSFVVSRAVKYVGVRACLVLVPLVSFTGYSMALVAPLISVLFAARVAESTLDYSLSSTIRQSLWLVTPRQAKYKAKQVVDSFMWRAGDTVSALVVWLGVRAQLGTRGFVAVNVITGALWVTIAILAGRAYARKARPAAPRGELAVLPVPKTHAARRSPARTTMTERSA